MLGAKEKGEDFNKEKTERGKIQRQGEMVQTNHPPHRARTPFQPSPGGPGVQSQARLESSGKEATPKQ